jgi:multidrug efflux pump subunit AcrA (membrane-fusion protein)
VKPKHTPADGRKNPPRRTDDKRKAALAAANTSRATVTRETLNAALAAARRAPGNTLLVLVSARQAERLYLALKIADREASFLGKIDIELGGPVARYAELSK